MNKQFPIIVVAGGIIGFITVWLLPNVWMAIGSAIFSAIVCLFVAEFGKQKNSRLLECTLKELGQLRMQMEMHDKTFIFSGKEINNIIEKTVKIFNAGVVRIIEENGGVFRTWDGDKETILSDSAWGRLFVADRLQYWANWQGDLFSGSLAAVPLSQSFEKSRLWLVALHPGYNYFTAADLAFFEESRFVIDQVLEKKKFEFELSAIKAEVNNLKERLVSAEAQMLQADKATFLSELSSGIAHELNTPLTTIFANTDFLMMTTKDDSTQESLEHIIKAASYCKDIVKNLMQYTKEEKAVLEDVDLNHVLEQALTMIRGDFKKNGITTKVDLTPLPLISANSYEMMRVFMNLLSNARDALISSKRFISREKIVMVRSMATQDEIRVEIEDNGSGIASKHIGHIFDPFFTTKEVGKGTGLGLSVAKGIVEQYGGKIDVISSSEMHKTVFFIRFPIKPNEKEVSSGANKPTA